MDASICCWDAKRAFDSVRPVTAINYLFRGQPVRAWQGPGQGAGLINGEDWRSYQAETVVSPPFPEYTSGHSTFSAAGAEILKRFTGSDAFGHSFTQRAGTSTIEPGTVPATDVTLAWPTFSAAAAQAGLSRRYGGIHFAEGDLTGRVLGRVVAAQVWDRAQHFIRGAGMPSATSPERWDGVRARPSRLYVVSPPPLAASMRVDFACHPARPAAARCTGCGAVARKEIRGSLSGYPGLPLAHRCATRPLPDHGGVRQRKPPGVRSRDRVATAAARG